MTSGERSDTAGRWAELRRRLAAVSGPASTELSTDQEQTLLEERARLLARPVERTRSGDRLEPYVQFRADEARYAVPAADVLEVVRVTELALLPGAEAPLVGVTAHRGDLLMVVDVRTAGVTGSMAEESHQVLVLQSGGARVGLMVDELLGIEVLAADELHQPTRGGTVPVAGVTGTGVAVIETRALTRAQR